MRLSSHLQNFIHKDLSAFCRWGRDVPIGANTAPAESRTGTVLLLSAGVSAKRPTLCIIFD